MHYKLLGVNYTLLGALLGELLYKHYTAHYIGDLVHYSELLN